jgi:hypothetical protein
MSQHANPQLPFAESRHIVWPANRFYWSVVDAGVGSSRPSDDYLDSLAEPDFPFSLDDLHVVHTPLRDGAYLACALRKVDLDALPEGTLTLAPDALPESMREEGAVPTVNLLVKQYEPRLLVRERTRRWMIATGSVVAALLLLTVGLIRRSAAWSERAAELARASETSIREAISSGTASDVTPTLWSLEREIESLRATRADEAKVNASPDATLVLASVLASFPRTQSLRTDVLAVSPTTITLNVATDADPQAFLKALAAPAGWTLDEPRLSTSKGSATLAIQMRREKKPGGTP